MSWGKIERQALAKNTKERKYRQLHLSWSDKSTKKMWEDGRSKAEVVGQWPTHNVSNLLRNLYFILKLMDFKKLAILED